MKRVLVVLFSALFLFGCSNTVEVDGAKINYDELQSKIKTRQSELKEIEDKLSVVKRELTQNEAKYNKLEKMADEQDQVKKDLDEAKVNLINAQSDVASAKKELEKLQGEIIKVKGDPIKVNAGYFYFGSDIEPGRYKITAQEGKRGNIFIRRDGMSYVADTFDLSGDRGAVTDFVFESIDGDEIEAKIPVYLYPVD